MGHWPFPYLLRPGSANLPRGSMPTRRAPDTHAMFMPCWGWLWVGELVFFLPSGRHKMLPIFPPCPWGGGGLCPNAPPDAIEAAQNSAPSHPWGGRAGHKHKKNLVRRIMKSKLSQFEPTQMTKKKLTEHACETTFVTHTSLSNGYPIFGTTHFKMSHR